MISTASSILQRISRRYFHSKYRAELSILSGRHPCRLCASAVRIQKGIRLICGHTFCETCLCEVFRTILSGGEPHVHCCCQPIPYQQLAPQLLSPREVEHFLKILQDLDSQASISNTDESSKDSGIDITNHYLPPKRSAFSRLKTIRRKKQAFQDQEKQLDVVEVIQSSDSPYIEAVGERMHYLRSEACEQSSLGKCTWKLGGDLDEMEEFASYLYRSLDLQFNRTEPEPLHTSLQEKNRPTSYVGEVNS